MISPVPLVPLVPLFPAEPLRGGGGEAGGDDRHDDQVRRARPAACPGVLQGLRGGAERRADGGRGVADTRRSTPFSRYAASALSRVTMLTVAMANASVMGR